ncbi:NUDIX hydrolase [Serinibacter arcticus]|uniref:NUDIX hydrolase n=1 Tax=Serinibacter arcticus TaxID=1655435 RepID=A0A2U1ZXW2_9MICO|nr:NUDIX hydrolase [Serinibacter arcticus]PWD51828.1 NUDIX hydrolase [Serinibacter arcticus]
MVSTPKVTGTVHAAGAVVWRTSGKRLEVLLVHRPRYDDWSWPKGKLDPGETIPACAVREVAEETGEDVVLGLALPQVRYRLDDGRLKVCHYWAGHVVDPDNPSVLARGEIPPCDPREIDESRWVHAREAREMLTRPADRAPLDALVDLWEDGVLDTRAFVVLRHARARKRSAWKGGETDRPLTATGLHDAVALVGTLAAFGIVEVASSPWERCTATVAPYASAAQLEILEVPELTEASTAARPKHAARAVEKLMAAFRPRRAADPASDGAVVCTHRPVLPTVLETLSGRAPRRVSAQFPDSNPYLRTGEMLVTHVLPRHRRGVRIVAVERHRPTA